MLDSFTAFLINLFTAGCNGVTKLYPTLWSSRYIIVSGDYFCDSDKFGVPELLCGLWWYYQTIPCFARDGFSILFSKNLVCLNHLSWNLTLSRPDHFASLTVSMDHSSWQWFTETVCHERVLANHLWVLCLAAYHWWQFWNLAHIVFNSRSQCLHLLKTHRTMQGSSLSLFKLDV